MTKTAIVIGGGIAGCSSAYALAQRGFQVTLLERNASIANEASGNPLAMLYPRLSADTASSAFALAAFQSSVALYQSLDLSPETFQQCGMLQLGFNLKELRRIQLAATQAVANSNARLLNSAEASAIAGITLSHPALYYPDAGWVQPQGLCQRLTQHHNISVLTSAPVSQIRKTPDHYEILTATGILNAAVVVIANANSAQQLLPNMQISTQAVRGQISLLTATIESQALNTIICSDGYFSPAAYQGMHCLGASFVNVSDDGYQQAALNVTHADHLENLHKLQHISKTLHAALANNINGGRTSLRCTASDYWPLAGQIMNAALLKAHPPRPSADINTLPWMAGLYVNIAHGSKGFTTAPLCAEMIACMASQKPLPVNASIAGLLNPNRFQLKLMGLKRLAKIIAYTNSEDDSG